MSKRIPYKITDINALEQAFPELIAPEVIVKKNIDKHRLYKLVKTMHSIGRSIPGVEIDFAAALPPQSDLENAA